MIDSIVMDVSIEEIIAPQAAAQTAVNLNSAPIFVGDCEGFAIMAAIGTIAPTGTVGFKLKQGDLADGSDLQDVAGSALASMGDTDDNKSFLSEVVRSRGKYVSPNITRGTANSDVRGVWILKYKKRVSPVVQGAKIFAAKQLGSPANGTA